jgi:Na+/proline symporter
MVNQMSLSGYDYIVIVFYLVFVFALGPVYKSFNRTASDYFRGGGNMLWWVVGGSAFVTSFSAWSFTGGAGKAYETGTFFLLIFYANVIAFTFMYFFTAARYRQMRVITAVEGIRKRFGFVNEQAFAWLFIPSYTVFGSIWLYAIAVFMSGALGMNMSALIIILGVVIIGMTMLGGCWAATSGDFVQALVILTITVMMGIMVLIRPEVGGIGGLIEKIPTHHYRWTEFCRPFIIIFFAATLLFNHVIQNNSISYGASRFIFVKDGREAKKAALIPILGFLLLTPLWMVPPMAATFFHPDMSAVFPHLNNPNEGAYIAMALTVLPKGLVGLLICAVFAASVTSITAQLNTSSGTFVRNFYIRVVNKTASEARQILVGRIFTLIYGAIWIVVALSLQSLKNWGLFNLVLMASACVGIPTAIPLFYGIFIKRTPSWAGWSTVLVGLSFSVMMQFMLTADFIKQIGQRFSVVELNVLEIGDLNIAITTGVNLAVCTIWFFATMLFYKPGKSEYNQQVDKFFQEMNTPRNTDEEHAPAYQSDYRQLNLMGNLCLIYGASILCMLFFPNSMTSRIYIAICGGFISGLGALMRFSAYRRGKNSSCSAAHIAQQNTQMDEA